ncbi:MAG: hypothetical protein F9K38_14815 [Pseudorhodoplanes sp.]|nr:MAG: hypothetical protein F9K38_14815 [Pseudorhodoplanes sp.]
MGTDETSEPKSGVTEEDLAIAFEGPAVYSNRVLVNVGPVVRLSFVETFGKEKTNVYRAAVALPHETAIQLANILKARLAEIERDLEEFKAEAAAEAEAKAKAGQTNG